MAKKKKRATREVETNAKNETRITPEKARTLAETQAQNSSDVSRASDAWSESGDYFWLAASLILLLAIFLRQWKLGDAPFHPDEAIHANYALALGDYRYDPTYHGPLLYHLVAVVFHFLGDSDFSARLVPSLLGIGLVALALGGARRWLGARGALWSAGLLAISPVLVTYSRRLLHDSLVLILTFGAVLCFQSARENASHTTRGRGAGVGLAALLTLLLATKANSFFIIAMLGSFWLMTGWQTVSVEEIAPENRTRPNAPLPSPTVEKSAVAKSTPEYRRTFWNIQLPFWLPMAALGFATAVSIWALRGGADEKRNEKILMLASLCAVALVWEWLRRAPRESLAETSDTLRPMSLLTVDWITPTLALGVAILLFTFFYGRAMFWPQTHDFMGGVREAWGNPPLFGSKDAPGALRRMIAYWGGQQGKPRLPGRHDYYLVLMALYELPILIAGIGGLIHASRKRAPFTDLLLWWAFTSWILYAMANEKVPWLMTHMITPLALLGGIWLAQIRPRAALKSAFALACCAGFIYLIRNVSAANFERAADNHEPMFYAQTSENFRDALFDAMNKTRDKPGGIWVQPEKSWPMVWYLRRSKERLRANVLWSETPGDATLKFAVHLTPGDWQNEINKGKVTGEEYATIQNQLRGWPQQQADFLIWPRPSWPALRPDRWARWWWNREATEENGVLSEWSSSPAIVARQP